MDRREFLAAIAAAIAAIHVTRSHVPLVAYDDDWGKLDPNDIDRVIEQAKAMTPPLGEPVTLLAHPNFIRVGERLGFDMSAWTEIQLFPDKDGT